MNYFCTSKPSGYLQFFKERPTSDPVEVELRPTSQVYFFFSVTTSTSRLGWFLILGLLRKLIYTPQQTNQVNGATLIKVRKIYASCGLQMGLIIYLSHPTSS